MDEQKIEAYWFVAGDKLPHGDNRPIVVGETHSVKGPIILCRNALHASRDPFDALRYAPGRYLYKVLSWGDIKEENDRLGSRHRTYVAKIDATALLQEFVRKQALSVIHLWNAPNVVRQYLETGDATLRAAARGATLRAAARDATLRAAARDATLRAAARDATLRDAARAAARAAAEDAAWAAAWAAARDAAWAAAWAAARDAARAAARDAARAAARAAARDAAWAAAWDAARQMFNQMVEQAFKEAA